MLVIGIGGVAKSGKDLFCQMLLTSLRSQGKDAIRLALADPLKADIREFSLKHYRIDPVMCPPHEKEIVRPMMVAHGRIKRVLSEGRYWTSLLENRITIEVPDIVVVPDIRYALYRFDEAWWVKTKMNGVLVHLERTENGSSILPPNDEEKENDPKVKEQADYIVTWGTVSDQTTLQPYVDDFVGWLTKTGKL